MPSRAELALRDHALAFLEQVGQDAGVDDRDRLRGVGDDEAAPSAVWLALDAARLRPGRRCGRRVLRRLVRRDLRRREEEHQVALERVQHQRRGDAERGDAAERSIAKRLCRGFIGCVSRSRPRARRRRGASAMPPRCRARRRRSNSGSATSATRAQRRSAPDVEAVAAHREEFATRYATACAHPVGVLALALEDDRAQPHQRDGDRSTSRTPAPSPACPAASVVRHRRRLASADTTRPGAACSTTSPRNR